MSLYTGSQKEFIMAVFMSPGDGCMSGKKVLQKHTFSLTKNDHAITDLNT